MKQITYLLLFLIFCTSCFTDPDYEDPITQYTPILIDREDLNLSIKLEAPTLIKNYGKIYRKDNLLFVNEMFEGVHVYNNQDPSNPEPLGFIRIPGNLDISIKDDVIYADNATDLVALKYDGTNLTVLDRNPDVFPEMPPPDGLGIPLDFTFENRPPNTVIVKWTKQ